MRPLRTIVLGATAALLLQSFQCSSPELSTAKAALKNQDYAKARTSAEAVLAKEPQSVEALQLLVQVGMATKDTDLMVRACRNIQANPSASPKDKDEASLYLYNAWVTEYNQAITAYNAWTASDDRKDLNEAITRLRAAIAMKPEMTEPAPLLGMALVATGDTTEALRVYERWWESERPGFDVAIAKGIVLDMARAQVLRTMGTPVQQRVDSLQGGGLVYKDRFDVGGRDFYVFSRQDVGAVDGVVEGWTYAPPATLSPGEQARSRQVGVGVLKSLADIVAARGDGQKALDYIATVVNAKPGDPDAAARRAAILIGMGQGTKAIAELKSMLDRTPDDVGIRVAYAGQLAASGQVDEAAAEYERVLVQEPRNEAALYSLAAIYKNKAVARQQAERERTAKDKGGRPAPDNIFLGHLERSASYFERLRQLPTYRDNYTVVDQLANIYDVRGMAPKVAELVRELEAMEPAHRSDKGYYEVLRDLYARLNMLDKAKAIEQRLKTMQ